MDRATTDQDAPKNLVTLGPDEGDEAAYIDDEDGERAGLMEINTVGRKMLSQQYEVVYHTWKWVNDKDDSNNYHEIEEINSGIEKCAKQFKGIILLFNTNLRVPYLPESRTLI
ncbi:unnamed protein product [Lepeophtheirus salmonis]|uniref:(salmon louse) hypothetical protein n=1 Tax=Lepeophtheirus salmonis TaxID=72036 RepID=A0A7R8CMF4_LEPSM|nr:unnamed protein product [Lepeophtheirus salmonis]CAF2837099.1 unnamed protein product [Lepeophtheirus salmonis]